MNTCLLLLLSLVLPAEPLKVVCTVPTYGDLVTTIGGDLVEVVVLTRSTQDMHAVAATPSLMAKIRDSALLFHTGLDGEPWLDPMLRGSGNTALLPGGPGSIDMSAGLHLKEVPDLVSRSQGDVHAYGNTHLWTDPLNVRTMAARVRDALIERLPDHADEIRSRHQAFHDALTAALVRWLTEYQHLKGRPVACFHKSWPYFLDRFGLIEAGTIEPKPRVAPTAAHLEELIQLMKAQHVSVILREPFQDPQATAFVAQATGAQVIEVCTHPAEKETIIEYFDHLLASIDTAMKTAPGG